MPIIRHKRSNTNGAIPTTVGLQNGEIAINTWNGRAWFKRIQGASQTLIEFFTTQGGTLLGFLTLHADPTSALHAVTKQYVDARQVNVYNSSGLISIKPKFWVGTATVSSGAWSVNYSSAGFTQVLSIQVTGPATSTNTGDRNIPTVRRDTITLTGCSGMCSNTVTAGLLLATVLTNSNNVTIDVLVIGI